MSVPKFDSPEEEIKKWLNYIALICVSEEFHSLKMELEVLYQESNVENFRLAAFQDALYAFLSQEENEQMCQSSAY